MEINATGGFYLGVVCKARTEIVKLKPEYID
jgi:hypothetical protein